MNIVILIIINRYIKLSVFGYSQEKDHVWSYAALR